MTLLAALGLGRRTLVMGVLNITPDSFSDGGSYLDPKRALMHAREMIEAGADIIDVGGESTRPATFRDASPLDPTEEMERILPAIAGIVREFPSTPISVDTYKARVARAALDAGARIVNDISGLTFDPAMAALVGERAAHVVLMHLPGAPRDIDPDPRYGNVVGAVKEFLRRQADVALEHGVAREEIIIDPGIGFGKNVRENYDLIREIGTLAALGYPVMVGPSRKSFMAEATRETAPERRVGGTAAAVAIAIAGGASIVRVHDVAEMVQVARVADALTRSSSQ